ncbi:hypothetical protein TNCV_4491271 [Trichonephila clavipes]|nr:hypothetical protein TNCV_4491271 [Trichonephila clavipes]
MLVARCQYGKTDQNQKPLLNCYNFSSYWRQYGLRFFGDCKDSFRRVEELLTAQENLSVVRDQLVSLEGSKSRTKTLPCLVDLHILQISTQLRICKMRSNEASDGTIQFKSTGK